MKSQQTGKQVKRIFVLYLTTLFLLSGCGPMAQSLVQSWVTITSVETSGPLEPVETVELAPAAGELPLCPQIPRPAVLLYLPGDDYALFDPAGGATCTLSFAEAIPGMVLMAQDDLFVASRTIGPEGEATVIQRYRADGRVEGLPYTMTDTQAGTELVAFAVSDDARVIAWSTLGPTAGSDLPVTSLLIADLEAGQVLHGVAPEVGAAPLALLPIRFSQDGSVLYYALQPYGLGGIWSSYVARYHNLYAVSTSSNGTPELLFDCAEVGTGLCLGDFSVYDSTVTGLAYVNQADSTIIIQNSAGDILNVLTAEEEYIGYPTWGPGGELVFYTADLSDDPALTPLPQLGLLHRVAPHTAPAETVARAPGLVLPVHFFSDTQVVVGWVDENESRGLALVGIDGTGRMLAVPAGATVLSAPALSPLLGVSGGGGIVSTP
jgi:hypothetical protein